MALDTAAVVNKVRDLAVDVTGVNAAYSAGDDAHPIPSSLATWPAIFVYPGQTRQYKLSGGGSHFHEYEITVQVLQAGYEHAQFTVLPMIDRLIELAVDNHRLGSLGVTQWRFDRSSGLVGLTWGGKDHLGYEVIFVVTHHAAATPATGE